MTLPAVGNKNAQTLRALPVGEDYEQTWGCVSSLPALETCKTAKNAAGRSAKGRQLLEELKVIFARCHNCDATDVEMVCHQCGAIHVDAIPGLKVPKIRSR